MTTDRTYLITGASGGQGASHAQRLLADGANVVALDVGTDLPEEPTLAADDDRRLEARVDVRDVAALDRAVAAATEHFGGVDVVIANAGINGTREPAHEVHPDEWQRVIDINLIGVWKTLRAATPALLASSKGPNIVIIGSTCAIKGYPTTSHYTVAKHGLTGLLKVLSAELAPLGVRVNMINPTTVDTELIHVQAMYDAFVPDGLEKNPENFEAALRTVHQMDVPWIQPSDVTEAMLWLSSDAARYVTGAQLSVDAGAVLK